MLYIRNKQNLSEVVFKNHTIYYERSAFSLVKSLAEKMFFSYESRVKQVKKQLNINVRIPLYLNNELLLIPTMSPKNYETIWLNYFKILKLVKNNQKTIVVFNNLESLEVNISYNILKRGLANAAVVLNKYLIRNNNALL